MMSDMPQKIWAFVDLNTDWRFGHWSEKPLAPDEYTEYARADPLAAAQEETSRTELRLNNQMAQMALKHQAEITSLREALQKIAEQKRTDELETPNDVEFADFEEGYDGSIDIARAAIKVQP